MQGKYNKMEERRTSVFENGLIWFGAAVSIAEILTGTYFALLMGVDIIVGNTLPDMLITIAICICVSKIKNKIKK